MAGAAPAFIAPLPLSASSGIGVVVTHRRSAAVLRRPRAAAQPPLRAQVAAGGDSGGGGGVGDELGIARAAALDARVVLRSAAAAASQAERMLQEGAESMSAAEIRGVSEGLRREGRAVENLGLGKGVLEEERKAVARSVDGVVGRVEVVLVEVEAVEEEVRRREAERIEKEASEAAVASAAKAATVGEGEAGLDDQGVGLVGEEARFEGREESVRESASTAESGTGSVVGSVVDVGKMKDTILEGKNVLVRRASTVGADLQGTVREFTKGDGSVDLDKVRTSVRGGLDSFGNTWERLNGRDPAVVADGDVGASSGGPGAGVVTDARASEVAPPRNDAKIAKLRTEIGSLEKALGDASKARETVLRREDQLGKLIRAREIREMDDNVSGVRRTLAVKVMQLETENVFTSLWEEVERSGFELMEQRVMVAEFGDIDSRLESLAVFVDQGEPALVDDVEVGVLASDIQDLKMRLGLDAPLYSARFDAVMVRQALSSSLSKAKTGIEFYSRGLKLFGGDCVYALRLFRRVFVGFTLSPREVRTLRRTGRDLLTLIPFTIILILPLTPVGHVLIFSFIQRYWPDFFPSTFTERRQALMRRHERYAKTIEDEMDPSQLGSSSASLGSVDSSGDNSKRGKQRFGIFGRLLFRGETVSTPPSSPADSATGKSEAVEVDAVAVASSDVLSKLADERATSPASSTGSGDAVDLGSLSDRATAEKASRRGGRRSAGTRGEGAGVMGLDDLHLAD